MSDAKETTDSSIQIITRHDRSLYTHIIHVVVRPFRQYLGRPGKQQPEGSVELDPHKSAYKGCNVTHRTVCDIHVYDIISKKAPSPEDMCKRIYYFSGGGWQSPPSSQHWHNCAKVRTNLRIRRGRSTNNA